MPKVPSLFGTNRLKATSILAAIAILVASHFLVSRDTHELHVIHVILGGLFILPIIASALWFGLRATLAVTGLISLSYFVYIRLAWPNRPMENANQYAMIAVYWVIGVVGGTLADLAARESAERERVNRELEIARDVQQHLFPQSLPPVAALDYFATCRPALCVAGDYYDFIALPDRKLAIMIGDVSGKGIGAALMMAGLQASLRSLLNHGHHESPQLMASINRWLYGASEPARYATLFYAEYDACARKLNYVNAGHNAPLLYARRWGNGKIERLETGGTVVGLFPDVSFEQATLHIEPGDMLVAFTDGITEAMNKTKQEFGELRLVETINDCDSRSAAQIGKRIFDSVDAFATSEPQGDDMTLLVMKFLAE